MNNNQNPATLRAAYLDKKSGKIFSSKMKEINDETDEILSSYSKIISVSKVKDQNLVEVSLEDGSTYRFVPNQYTQLFYDKMKMQIKDVHVPAATQYPVKQKHGIAKLWDKIRNIFTKKQEPEEINDDSYYNILLNPVPQFASDINVDAINNDINKYVNANKMEREKFEQDFLNKEAEERRKRASEALPVVKIEDFSVEDADGTTAYNTKNDKDDDFER